MITILCLTWPGASHCVEATLNIRHGGLELRGVEYLFCQRFQCFAPLGIIVMEDHLLKFVYYHILGYIHFLVWSCMLS